MTSNSMTEHIADQVRQRINDGSLAAGALLPSEPELAREHDVSRQTARAALQLLEHEGLVTVLRRRGRIVRSQQRLRWRLSAFEHPDLGASNTVDAWEADIESQGHDPTWQDLEVETVPPPEAVATRLGLDAKIDQCVLRSRVRYIDGKPALLSDDYFDERVVRGTELAADEDTTREDVLARAGYEQTYDIDEIITRMPTQSESERLGLSSGTPVAELIRTGYTVQDQAVRVMVSIVPGDTLVLQYVVPT